MSTLSDVAYVSANISMLCTDSLFFVLFVIKYLRYMFYIRTLYLFYSNYSYSPNMFVVFNFLQPLDVPMYRQFKYSYVISINQAIGTYASVNRRRIIFMMPAYVRSLQP